jgi:hypothetical protein
LTAEEAEPSRAGPLTGPGSGRYRGDVVLVAFVLVLAAAASFAAGIATSRTSDTLVYVSIVFSLIAFVILAVASMRAREAGRVVLDERLPDDDWTSRSGGVMETEAAAGPLLDSLDETQLDMAPSWRRQARERWREEEVGLGDDDVDDVDDDLERALEAEEDDADAEVPVEALPPAEPLLLEATVIARRDWQTPVEPYGPDPGQETAAHDLVLDDDLDLGLGDDLDLEDDELDALDVPDYEPLAAVAGEVDPIEDYDDLTAAEIVPQLHDLELDELQWVQRREQTGAKRATVLVQVGQLIADAGGGGAPAPAAKKTARKTTAGRSPAKRATAKKKTPAKKSSAKKSGTSRAKAAPSRSASKTRRG